MSNGYKQSVTCRPRRAKLTNRSALSVHDIQADIDGLCAAPPEFRRRLCAWIRANISHATKTYSGHSYGLKHRFSEDTRSYVTNGIFKAALLVMGFVPLNPHEQHWRYRLKVKEDSDRWPEGGFISCWPQAARKEDANAA